MYWEFTINYRSRLTGYDHRNESTLVEFDTEGEAMVGALKWTYAMLPYLASIGKMGRLVSVYIREVRIARQDQSGHIQRPYRDPVRRVEFEGEVGSRKYLTKGQNAKLQQLHKQIISKLLQLISESEPPNDYGDPLRFDKTPIEQLGMSEHVNHLLICCAGLYTIGDLVREACNLQRANGIGPEIYGKICDALGEYRKKKAQGATIE
jgi:hypothetical protein